MTSKSKLFLRLARPYVARRLRKQFADVRLGGADRLRQLSQQGPLILACNHVAWWDPLLLVHLDSHLGSDGYCLMDDLSLNQFPFFRWVGAVPIDRSSSRAAYRDVQSAGALLDAPRRIVAIFPQGKQRPAHFPLNFKAGVSALAARSGAPVVPMAIRYDYLESPRQIIHLKAEEPLHFSPDLGTREHFLQRLEDAICSAQVAIDEQLYAPNDAFVSLLNRKRAGTNQEGLALPAAALRALATGERHE